jgi:hypothetical protein
MAGVSTEKNGDSAPSLLSPSVPDHTPIPLFADNVNQFS